MQEYETTQFVPYEGGIMEIDMSILQTPCLQDENSDLAAKIVNAAE